MKEEEKAIKTLKEDYELANLGIALNLIETQKAELEKRDREIDRLKDELGYTRKVVEGEKKDGRE